MLALPLVLLAALPVGGEIRSDGATVVVVGEPPPAGETVQVPEGWYRVDSAPDDDDDATGSLAVVSPEVLALAAPVQSAPAPQTVTPEPVQDPLERSCRQLRSAYAKELLRTAGIEEVDQPLDFLERLQGPGTDAPLSPWVRLNLFGLPGGGPWEPSLAGVPVLRPLAWDFELQSLAREISHCREDVPDVR